MKDYVIAGDYKQFRWFCNQRKEAPNKYIYLTQSAQIRGVSFPIVYYVGTWYELPIDTLDEINRLILQSKGKIAYVMEDGGIKWAVETGGKAAL